MLLNEVLDDLQVINEHFHDRGFSFEGRSLSIDLKENKIMETMFDEAFYNRMKNNLNKAMIAVSV